MELPISINASGRAAFRKLAVGRQKSNPVLAQGASCDGHDQLPVGDACERGSRPHLQKLAMALCRPAGNGINPQKLSGGDKWGLRNPC